MIIAIQANARGRAPGRGRTAPAAPSHCRGSGPAAPAPHANQNRSGTNETTKQPQNETERFSERRTEHRGVSGSGRRGVGKTGPEGAALCTVSLLILLVCCCCCFIRGRGGRKKGTANRTAPQPTPKGTPASPEAVPPGEIRAASRGAEPEAGARREGGYGTPPLDGTVRKPRKRRRTPNRSHRL